MNYSTLCQAIMDWLNKDNIASVLPYIVKFGQQDLEDKIFVSGGIRAMEYKPTNAAINAGTATLDVPADYLGLIYMDLLDGENRNPIELRQDVREIIGLNYVTTETGLPRRIYRLEDKFYFDVKTDIQYTREWSYWRRLTTLVEASPNNTNWWVANAEEALLMSCLNKASAWVSGIPEGDKKKWEEGAKDARERLILNHHREMTSGATMRTEGWTL